MKPTGAIQMKSTKILIAVLFSLTLPALAEVTVAVTPFEASDYRLKKHTSYAQGELENLILMQDNVIVVERKRMDRIAEEGSFGNFSGMADPNTSAKFGRMLGAQILFTGSILKVDTAKKDFSGFGVSTKASNTVATIRIRAYDVEKGSVVFSQNLKGSSSSFSTNFGSSSDADPASMAIEHAISKLKDSKKFIKLLSASKTKQAEPQMVSVEFAPQPENIDLEVNGIYYGSTPMTVDLPAGAPIKIKLSKPGYEVWEKSLMPRVGMRVGTVLEKKVKTK